ncbi:hypothetical protein VTO42DRAFT_203 [Malbranchea cinnamomea]
MEELDVPLRVLTPCCQTIGLSLLLYLTSMSQQLTRTTKSRKYSILSAEYRGYARLELGVTGTRKSTYYFSGQTEQVGQWILLPVAFRTVDKSTQTSTTTTWKESMDKDYLLHDEAPSTSTIWSPCGANESLNINTQVRLTSTNSKATGILTNYSLDASFRQNIHIRWRECKR